MFAEVHKLKKKFAEVHKLKKKFAEENFSSPLPSKKIMVRKSFRHSYQSF